MKYKSISIFKLICYLLIFLSFSCSAVEESIDETINNALNFEGIFANDSGWQVELETIGGAGEAYFIKAGTKPLYNYKVGDALAKGMIRVTDNSWRGLVMEAIDPGFLEYGNIEINGTTLKVIPDNGPSYSLEKVNSGSGSGESGTGSKQVVLNQCVEGKIYDKIVFHISVPKNVKNLQILTTEVQGSCDYNLADLFVKKGSDPTVSTTSGYTWSADCASVKPNREDELCSFSNPASGEWSIMLYGYNSSFVSNLKVTLTY